ncbi:MAG: hypothetical protein WC444_05840 [Candidatus Paceibacterota bacterium]
MNHTTSITVYPNSELFIRIKNKRSTISELISSQDIETLDSLVNSLRSTTEILTNEVNKARYMK